MGLALALALVPGAALAAALLVMGHGPFNGLPVETEVLRELADWQPTLLERRDLLASEPRYRERGLSAMHTAAYRLRRRIDRR